MRPILQSNFGLTGCRGVPFVLHRLFLLTRRLLRCVAGLKNLFLPAADACPPSGFTPARDAGSGRRQRRLDATLLEHSDGRRGPPAAAPRAAATPARSTGVRRQPARHPTRPGSRPPARNSRIGRSLGTRSRAGPCENIPGCRTSGPRIDSMPLRSVSVTTARSRSCSTARHHFGCSIIVCDFSCLPVDSDLEVFLQIFIAEQLIARCAIEARRTLDSAGKVAQVADCLATSVWVAARAGHAVVAWIGAASSLIDL